jgi:transposase, IS30 family
MGKNYEHLSVTDRAMLHYQLSLGCKLRAIARSLQRAPSTISRELRRNGWSGQPFVQPAGRTPNCIHGYEHSAAHARARQLAAKPRTPRKLIAGEHSPLWQRIYAGLRRGLSPEQVSSTLRQMDSPQRISHETIYTAIYLMPKGELRTEVLALLRKARSGRRPRSQGQDRRGQLRYMNSIKDRPPEVDERLVPGHWEGDLIKGAGNKSQVGTLVERKTLFTLLVQVPQATAQCTANAFAGVLGRVDAQMRLSLTYDQGREMAEHLLLSRLTGMDVYFAHPHSPWERGINENTNGLLRQYLPKGTDLAGHSQADLDAIALTMNVRPRKSLGWKCPAELFLPAGSFDFKAYWADALKIDSVALGG